MHILRFFLLLSVIVGIAGCSGLNARNQQNQIPADSTVSEFLYVGTTSPGLLTYEVMSHGTLKSVPGSAAAPAVCAPFLSPVPGRIYSLSQRCPFDINDMELRRIDLNPSGEIAASTVPLSIGPGTGSTSGVLNFVAAPAGNFAFIATNGPDFREHISPAQITTTGDLVPEPGLGISWPREDTSVTGCSSSHLPSMVTNTPDGTFLLVQNQRACKFADGPILDFPIYKLDPQTGGIETSIGGIGVNYPAGAFIDLHGSLALRGETSGAGGIADVQLLRIGAGGVTILQECKADQPACANPDAGAFHPSGKWAFIADSNAGGIWTVPVSGNSITADKASFLAANIGGGVRFVFSADGRNMYLAHWGGIQDFGEILGFNVDQETGTLTPIAGSPWPIGSGVSITSAIDVTGKAQ